jgi:Uma2 family endonuclease
MTAEEFLSLGETQDRYELIDGVVVLMSPSPSFKHQRLISILCARLESSDAARRGALVVPDVDVQLAPGLVYRPDVCVYLPGRLPEPVDRLSVPPDLVIEVLSPSTKPYDLITKRDDYERFGVREYWAIDPDDGRVRCWRRQADRLVEAPVEGHALECAAVPGLSVNLRELHQPPQ